MPNRTKNILQFTFVWIFDFFMEYKQFHVLDSPEYVISIWNNNWLHSELTRNFPYNYACKMHWRTYTLDFVY